ncbi:MAG: vitamin B12-dependent ribonucleotide reductase, partial [Acidobacteria bacterium]
MQRGVTQDAESAAQQVIENRSQDAARATRRAGQAAAAGLSFSRFFTLSGRDPFDEIAWDTRSALITNEKGEVVFEQKDVEVPSFWSQQATNIVVSKYFRGPLRPKPGEVRETSVRQLIGRVVDTITTWARAGKYFAGEADLQAFSDDLKHLLVFQKASFNSPVWFN